MSETLKTLCQLPVAQTPADVRGISAPFTVDPNKGVSEQVREYLLGIGDPRGVDRVALVGQAAPAIVVMAALELLGGLPEVAVIPPGAPGKASVLAGWIEADTFRQVTVRNERHRLPQASEGTSDSTRWVVVDASGRLSASQRTGIVASLGCADSDLVVVPLSGAATVNFSELVGGEGSDAIRVRDLIINAFVAAEVTFQEAAQGRIVLVPPGNATAAVLVALVLNGLSERWPLTVRFGGPATGFAVSEIINPNLERDWAKVTEAAFNAAKPRATLLNLSLEARAAVEALGQQYGFEVWA